MEFPLVYNVHCMALVWFTEVFMADAYPSRLRMGAKEVEPSQNNRHAKVTVYQPGTATTRDCSEAPEEADKSHLEVGIYSRWKRVMLSLLDANPANAHAARKFSRNACGEDVA